MHVLYEVFIHCACCVFPFIKKQKKNNDCEYIVYTNQSRNIKENTLHKNGRREWKSQFEKTKQKKQKNIEVQTETEEITEKDDWTYVQTLWKDLAHWRFWRIAVPRFFEVKLG